MIRKEALFTILLVFALYACKNTIVEPVSGVGGDPNSNATQPITFPEDLATTAIKGQHVISFELSGTIMPLVTFVDLYLGESHLASLAPPQLSYTLNTEDYSDGEHNLAVTAYNGNEVIAQAEIAIRIENDIVQDDILFQIDLESLSSSSTYFFFATDHENNIVGNVLRLLPGETGIISRPGNFDGDRASLHEVTSRPGTFFSIYSYQNVKTGLFRKSNSLNSRGNQIGTRRLTFTNIPSNDFHVINYGNTSTLRGFNFFPGNTIRIYENERYAYLYLRDGTSGRFQFFDDLEPGPETMVSLDNMETDMTYYQYSLPAGHTISTLFVDAYREDNNFNSATERYFAASGSSSPLSFHLPNSSRALSTYRAIFNFTDPLGNQRSYQAFGEMPDDVVIPNYSLITIGDDIRDIDISVTGNKDYFYDYWFAREAMGESQFWVIFGSDPDQIVFPTIPEAVTAHNSTISLDALIDGSARSRQTLAADYTHLENFDDYVNRVFGRGAPILDGAEGYFDISRFKSL